MAFLASKVRGLMSGLAEGPQVHRFTRDEFLQDPGTQ